MKRLPHPKVFDELTEPKIVECADDITKYYNDLLKQACTTNYWVKANTVNGKKIKIDLMN